MARVASETTITVATGERLTTKYEFARVLEEQAAGILQMNLGRVGGLLEAKKIAGGRGPHAQIAPHLYWAGRRSGQRPARPNPNFLILESIQDWGGFHAEILEADAPKTATSYRRRIRGSVSN